MNQVYLSLGAIVRDQEHYIKEWLTFYHLLGVERFILVLHHCRDKTEQRVRELPFFDRKIHLHWIEDEQQKVQLGAYKWILDTYGSQTHWMLFIDTDEFLFGTHEDHLPTLLERYEAFDGVAAHWLLFGCSGHVTRPAGLSIESMTGRSQDDFFHHKSVKSIVKPSKVTDMLTPHLCVTQNGTVREHGDVCSLKNLWYIDKEPTWDVLRVNHYYIRSMEDWVDRHRRGSCNCTRNNKFYSVSEFKKKDFDEVQDTTIHRFLGRMKKELGR